ncbi:MAG: rod shape-determining protein MreD [Clostridia bacterium]|nr:rod shape-determining protein MreD [Clostridia bacterium]
MKIFKDIKYFLICFFVIFFELTVGKYLEISGTVPMLSFCLCLAIATREEKLDYIITIGVVVGIVADLFSGHVFGTYAVTYTLSAIATYLLRNNIFSSTTLFLVCNTFVLTVLFSIIYYIFNVLNVGISFGTMILELAIPTALYNTAICVIFYLIFNLTLYKRR